MLTYITSWLFFRLMWIQFYHQPLGLLDSTQNNTTGARLQKATGKNPLNCRWLQCSFQDKIFFARRFKKRTRGTPLEMLSYNLILLKQIVESVDHPHWITKPQYQDRLTFLDKICAGCFCFTSHGNQGDLSWDKPQGAALQRGILRLHR